MKFTKISFFSIIVFVFLGMSMFGQDISGKVLKESDGKAIPFVSISIEGTTLGTVSDFEGVFNFEIPEEFYNNKILVSCVGFEENKIDIIDALRTDKLIIKLKSSSVDIDEVVVEQKSLYPYTILKNAINSISKNYINVPYNYEFYYSNTDKTKNKTLKREAIVLMYDGTGYKRTGIYETFKSVNYMFMQSKRNFGVKYLNDGNTNIDDLLEFDIVRHRGNILDESRIYDYDLVIKDEINFKGDSVWVLSYSSKKTDFVSSGDFSSNFYSGEIFIKKGDYAVLYNKTTVKSSNYSIVGRNIYDNGKKGKKRATYNFETSYKQQKSYYTLDKIDYKLNYDNLNRESIIDILKIFIEKPHAVSSRDYYEDLDFDKAFWYNFKH